MFLSAIPADLQAEEDRLPETVVTLNASRRSKLQRIYLLVDELAEIRAPFVACSKGCASCCHMNVSMTSAEAERLGVAIGRKPMPVGDVARRPIEHFAGQPCTFLRADGACSIYAHRPLSCRKHASFFEAAAPCHPSVMNIIDVPQVGFSGLDKALFRVSAGPEGPLLADIRDFFPPAN